MTKLGVRSVAELARLAQDAHIPGTWPDLSHRTVDAAGCGAQSAREPPTSTTKTHTCVAVIDDDESLCRSFCRLLRASGMQPVTYGSVEAFLSDFKHPCSDCLVLDVQLRGMFGTALAQRLVREGAHAPFIFITAHDDDGTRASAQAAGCAAYFRKNDSGAQVIEAIW